MDLENDPLDLAETSLDADSTLMVEKAWAIEIKRRSEELEKGLVETISWSDLQTQMRERQSRRMLDRKNNPDHEIS